MPLLAGLLVTLFGNMFSWFLKYAGTKVALAAAAITSFAALTTALMVAIAAILSGLNAVLPSVMPGLAIGIWVAVPDQTSFCISSYFAADAAIALYCWNTQNLKLAAYVT